MKKDVALSHLAESLKKCDGRYYTLIGTPEELALGALISERQAQRHESFTREDCAKFLAQLKPYAPSLFQARPESEEALHVTERVKALLKEFSDPVTGAPAFENPWSEEHKNLTEQMNIMRECPELGDHLKRVAKGATFSAIKKQRDEKAQRGVLRSIKYGPEEHKENPYRNGANVTALSEFRRVHGDLVSDFYRREAQPVSLPWLGQRNLSVMMTMQSQAPELRALVDRSIETAREWAQADITESEREAAAAMSRAATAKTILGTPAK